MTIGGYNGHYIDKKGRELPKTPRKAMNFACNMYFEKKPKASHVWDKNHDDVTLIQWCNDGTKRIKDDYWKVNLKQGEDLSCKPWSKTACEETQEDCLHQYYKKGEKMLFRCGIKRPLIKGCCDPIEIGNRLAIRAGFNVYDAKGNLKRRAGFNNWYPILIQTESSAVMKLSASLAALSLLALI